MFDRTDNRTSLTFPDEIKITKHEHRAPTDDSIRLHREYVEKARAEVAEMARCGDNILKYGWTTFRDPAMMRDVVVLDLVINGEKVDFYKNISCEYHIDPGKRIDSIRKMMAEALAEKIIADLFRVDPMVIIKLAEGAQ
jgi:hypothetical protein